MMEAMQGRMNMELAKDGSATMGKGKKKGGHPSWIPKFGKKPDHVGKEKENKGGHPANMPKDGNKAMAGGHPGGMPTDSAKAMGMGGHPGAPKNDITPEKKAKADAIVELARTLFNINRYQVGLQQSRTSNSRVSSEDLTEVTSNPLPVEMP